MHQNIEEFFTASREFTGYFDSWANAHSPAAVADHICYKCSSANEYEHLRRLFESASAFIYQSIISQRRIAIIRFDRPLPTALGYVRLLELSDQKPDGSQTSGFDHIEIYPTRGSMEDLVAKLESQGVRVTHVVRPHHTTYDIDIKDGFKVRIEPDALLAKVAREEMR